jgi:hypothetical protein
VENDQCDNNCCKDRCHYVKGGITITTDENSSHEDLCKTMDAIDEYTANYKSGKIEGVEGLDMKMATATVDGEACLHSKDSESNIPISKIESNDVPRSNDNYLHLFWLLLLALLLGCVFFFMHRRKQSNKRDVTEIEERVATYIDDIYSGDKQNEQQDKSTHPLNAIDVHTCQSSACYSCAEGKEQTRFIATNGPSWLGQSNTERGPSKTNVGQRYAFKGTDSMGSRSTASMSKGSHELLDMNEI